MYAQCVADGECEPPHATKFFPFSSYYGDSQYANYPVINVDWYQASDYCGWAVRRLSTEAEWEKAARGTDGRTYPWGDQPPAGNLVNFCDESCFLLPWKDSSVNDGYADTAPVGSYPEGTSEYGALDMAGNVWEWVADWYSETYYMGSPSENPQGPASGQSRVLRGGSWVSVSWLLDWSFRNWDVPVDWYYDKGFRCAR